jgi:hypothetical protein
VKRILRQASGDGRRFDLEAVESALRVAVLVAGARSLEEVLRGVGCGRRSTPVVCACGAAMRSTGLAEKRILTILGEVGFTRSRYECPECGRTRYPGDEELEVVGTSRSPGLQRMMARAGSRESFKEGSEDLRIYAGIAVSPKDVERVAEGIGAAVESWSAAERDVQLRAEEKREHRPAPKTIPILYVSYDGTGVPMVPAALKGRKGKQEDGSAKTREAKLGCVFTQTATDEEGRPVRDPESTSFVGAIETAEVFGQRIYAEALRRGLNSAAQVVVLGDGARWIRGLAELHFHQALQIIDLYHAKEHVANLCKLLWPYDDKQSHRHRVRWWTDLEAGKIEKIIREAKKDIPASKETAEKVRTEINYLEENKERMRYAAFREKGWFVGSGVVEAGCKTVIGKRLKQSGMEWSVRGANAIISLRCGHLSGRIEEFWESRCA